MMQEMFEMEPIHVDVKDPKTKKPRPHRQGEDIIYLWDKIYATDAMMKGIVVNTVTGPSTPGKDYVDDINANPAMPYQQLRALVGDGGKWKWPEIWKNLVCLLGCLLLSYSDVNLFLISSFVASLLALVGVSTIAGITKL